MGSIAGGGRRWFGACDGVVAKAELFIQIEDELIHASVVRRTVQQLLLTFVQGVHFVVCELVRGKKKLDTQS